MVEQKDNKLIIDKKVSAELPTKYGSFSIVAFPMEDHKEHVALVKGDITDKENVLCRVHSECLTGDAFGSLRCDCNQQLVAAMNEIEKKKEGLIIYLRQEGRGIGLLNKIKAYQLQDNGYDTAEANNKLGFDHDLRSFKSAVEIINLLKIKSIDLMTNNPEKVSELKAHGITINKRISVNIKPSLHNQFYLKTKKEKFGHFIDI